MALADKEFITSTQEKTSLKQTNTVVSMQEASRTRVTHWRNAAPEFVGSRELTQCKTIGIYYDVVMGIYFQRENQVNFKNEQLQKIPKPKSVDHIILKDGELIGVEFKYIDYESLNVKRNSSIARRHMAMKILASWYSLFQLGVRVNTFEIVTCHKEGFDLDLLAKAIERLIEKDEYKLTAQEKTEFRNVKVNVLSLVEFNDETNLSRYSDLSKDEYNKKFRTDAGKI